MLSGHPLGDQEPFIPPKVSYLHAVISLHSPVLIMEHIYGDQKANDACPASGDANVVLRVESEI